jgi:hypothetical protein
MHRICLGRAFMVKDTYPICERDGFPMLKINGRWECVAEYLDRCIGQQRVVDLVQRGKTVYYVFENGHELPMLCFCCGRPLVYNDLAGSRRDMRGRRLESMAVDTVTTQEGKEILQFRLEFSKKGLLSRRVSMPIAVKAAARLKHPDHCPYGRKRR